MTNQDRNFDGLVERFEQNIYQQLKGKIRQQVIIRDFEMLLAKTHPDGGPVADLGAGLGQWCIEFAKRNYLVGYTDISADMLRRAQELASEQHLVDKINWHQLSYQAWLAQNKTPCQIIICHALLEWLAEPKNLIPTLSKALIPGGWLSLCFYNPVSNVYRNLIRGNFNYVEQLDDYQADSGSLTPNNACDIETVIRWLTRNGFTVESMSGIRCFADYVIEKRGGHLIDDEVIRMELSFSQQEPYLRMARYVHILARYRP